MPKSKGRPSVHAGNGPSAAASVRLARQRGRESVPPFMLATLVYPFAFTSSSVTANVWYWQFRINSLFDPDFTGTGSQPVGFDQWMALYDRYRVLAVETDVFICGLSASDMASAASPGVDAAPTLTYPAVAGDRAAVLGKHVPAGTYPKQRLRTSILMKDVFGIDQEALMSELNYSGTSGTSAPSVAYWNVCSFTDQATGSIMLSGEIRFAVRFEQPHDNNISLTVVPREKPPVSVSSLTREELESRVRDYLASKGATATSAVAPVSLLRH